MRLADWVEFSPIASIRNFERIYNLVSTVEDLKGQVNHGNR